VEDTGMDTETVREELDNTDSTIQGDNTVIQNPINNENGGGRQ
jgi:hypothetical protein